MKAMVNKDKVDEYNEVLERLNPAEILYWLTMQDAGSITMTSSFQAQSLPLLYMVSRICPAVPVLFLDTGYHFKETLDYVDELQSLLNLDLVRITPLVVVEDEKMPWSNPDMCCYLRKVEPLQNELKKYDVWISGIRRDQTAVRKQVKILDYDSKNDVLKICPMANFSRHMIEQVNAHLNLPFNPLRQQGYLSIGCEPCTEKSVCGDERSGRWGQSGKTECGLHLPEEMYEKAKGKA